MESDGLIAGNCIGFYVPALCWASVGVRQATYPMGRGAAFQNQTRPELKLAPNVYLGFSFDTLMFLPTCERLYFETKMGTSRFCLSGARCPWWCACRKIMRMMGYCKAVVSSLLDDGDGRNWSSLRADNLWKSWIHIHWEMLYSIWFSHSMNPSVSQYVIRSFSYSGNHCEAMSTSQPAG
jgi:hypothetical protein